MTRREPADTPAAPGAIILAGGESRRMGQPKALCLYQGETFAARLARLFSAVCHPLVMVTGAYPSLTAPPATVIHNPGWRDGQITSLQVGLRAMDDAPAALFCPVDCPAFGEPVLALLWRDFQSSGAPLTIPRFAGRRGHPVLVARTLFGAFLEIPPDGQARTVIHAHRERTHYVDVEDAGVLADFDTPEALAEWRR